MVAYLLSKFEMPIKTCGGSYYQFQHIKSVPLSVPFGNNNSFSTLFSCYFIASSHAHDDYIYISSTDMNSSGDWQDLAAIEAKINKLGFGGLYCSAFYLFNSMPMISRSDVVEKQLLSVLSPSLRLSLLFFFLS